MSELGCEQTRMQGNRAWRVAWLWIGLVPGVGAQETQAPIFTEQAETTGLAFRHVNGMNGKFYYPEVNGPGGAVFDYDNDGDLDVLLVQGGYLGPDSKPPEKDEPLMDRLFRNDLAAAEKGRSKLRFTDITQTSKLRATGFGFGATAADYDNDGWVDLYITNFGPNQLWHNNGDGSFSDVTAESGTGDPRWSISASFFDYDGDGLLDLYVANYLNYTMENHKNCITASGRQDYCGPNSYDDARNRLYRNKGGNRFEDVTEAAGLRQDLGSSMGAVAADFNGDGRIDFYVANDADPNYLWLNQGDGSFRDEALLAGCAVNAFGKNEAGMGVDAGDYDGDGDEDILLTHLTGETHTLYRNDGTGMFEDVTLQTGLGTSTLEATGWGVAWFDYDNDGWLDFLVANGTVEAVAALVEKGDPYPYHQPNQLFRNLAGKGFEDISDRAGAVFALSEVSRGAAFGDLDNDGDTDVVVVNNNGPVRLMINEIGNTRHWLGIRAVAGPPDRDQLGARLCLVLPDQSKRWRRVHADGSYASGNDPRVIFGLGKNTAPVEIRVRWPDGTEESFKELAVDRYHLLRKGAASQ